MKRRSDNAALELEEAQKRAKKAIVDAEKFRASVEPPTGKYQDVQEVQLTSKSDDRDVYMCSRINTDHMKVLNQGQVLEQINNLEEYKRGDTLNIPDIGSGVSEDDFFHLTCHIDPTLIHKIEKGEFVELEKLLPKDRLGGKNDEGRMEWVHREGGMFLVPAQRDNKIASFRRWEQAFRAYATIYCGAKHTDRRKYGST